MWNERGTHLANSFIADATRTNHPWVRVLSKKEKCTYVDVAKPNPPLSGSNAIPLGSSQAHKRSSAFGRLNSLDLLRNLTDSASGSKVWRPVRSSIPAHGVLPAKNPEIAMNKESRAKSPGGLNLNLSLNLGSDSDPPQATIHRQGLRCLSTTKIWAVSNALAISPINTLGPCAPLVCAAWHV